MGYSGARGGREAIEAAEDLVRKARYAGQSPWLGLDQITERMRPALDRVMGEGGLWAPELAARAFRQAEGDVLEAAQLLRAHRSTLPRFAYSEPVSTDELRILRRISPAFRNPPGEQILGRTIDYVGRLLDLMPEERARAEATAARTEAEQQDTGVALPPPPAATSANGAAAPANGPAAPGDVRHPPRLLGVLRSMGMVAEREEHGDPEPYDITRVPARPGAPRSARLTAMARAETGALVHLWYLFSFQPTKHQHEIPGEVRHGTLPVRVRHPLTGAPVGVASVRVTEVETFDDMDQPGEDRTRLGVGYGLCFGHNERKAIAMAGLDLIVRRGLGEDVEQQVLSTLDGIEAAGFLEHLKLPHYVDFRSILDRLRAVGSHAATAHRHEDAPEHGDAPQHGDASAHDHTHAVPAAAPTGGGR